MKRRGTMEMRFGQARIDRRRALEGSERRLKIAGILQRLAERAPSFDMPWITRNQQIKPGNRMIDVRLPAPKLRALVAYLRSLR